VVKPARRRAVGLLAMIAGASLGWRADATAGGLPAVITPGGATISAPAAMIPRPRFVPRPAPPAVPGSSISATSPTACHDAALAAERDAALPPGMLDAIGRVESGRYDPASGQVWAWPWAVNAAGEGHSFATFEDAAAYVRERQAAGVLSIDVGCFQINLLHHPDAFASLEEAFDPAANAAYAARFLSDLRARGGGWATAIAWYHSATPGLGEPYRDMVLARWPGNGSAEANLSDDPNWHANPIPPSDRPAGAMLALAPVPTFGMRVWTPLAALPSPVKPAARADLVQISLHGAVGRLPRIMTASR